MDHVLLHGPPGLGKTTLAQIVARELGVGFRATSGPVIQRAGDLAAILTNLQPRDVLFIDEIHRLQPAIEEVLYPAMEDFQLDLIIGEGPAARSVRIDLSPFTLVGATTRAGLLATAAARPLRHPAAPGAVHTSAELELIVTRGAEKLGLALTPAGAVGDRAPVPRHAAHRRAAAAPGARLRRRGRPRARWTASRGRRRADCGWRSTGSGLDAMDRRYLRRIAEHHHGGPVGVETLAAALNEARDTLEDVIEPYLIQEGLVLRTSRGPHAGRAGLAPSRHQGRPRPPLRCSTCWILTLRKPGSRDAAARGCSCASITRTPMPAGMVYHARYLAFAERARAEMLRERRGAA